MISKQKVDFVGFVDQNGEEIKQEQQMTYLLLFSAINPDNGEEERRYEIIDGRFWVCERIMDSQNKYQYGIVNLFKSQIISEKVHSFLTNSISFYTFLRFCIEKGVNVGDDGNGNYMDLDELNNFVMNEYYEDMRELGMYDEDDLDDFYAADCAHRDYIPKNGKTE